MNKRKCQILPMLCIWNLLHFIKLSRVINYTTPIFLFFSILIACPLFETENCHFPDIYTKTNVKLYLVEHILSHPFQYIPHTKSFNKQHESIVLIIFIQIIRVHYEQDNSTCAWDKSSGFVKKNTKGNIQEKQCNFECSQ